MCKFNAFQKQILKLGMSNHGDRNIFCYFKPHPQSAITNRNYEQGKRMKKFKKKRKMTSF